MVVWKNEESREYQAYIDFWGLVLFVSSSSMSAAIGAQVRG